MFDSERDPGAEKVFPVLVSTAQRSISPLFRPSFATFFFLLFASSTEERLVFPPDDSIARKKIWRSRRVFSARCCGTKLSSSSGKGKSFSVKFRGATTVVGGVGSPPARRGVCRQHVTLFIGESHVSREIIGLCERLDKWSTAYGASRTTEARFRFHHPLPLIYPHQALGDSILFLGPRRFPECRRCNTQTPLRRCFSPRETGSLLRSGAPLFTFPIKATRESVYVPAFSF